VWPDLKEEIELELAQMRRLLGTYANLREKMERAEPDDIQKAALAAFLHSFYNGVENISKRVAIHLDGGPPRGETWHSMLLERMAGPGTTRPAVITEPMRDRLRKYMDFRHFFRHAYTFELKWNRMAPLVLAAEETLKRLEAELAVFLSAIEPKAETEGS
jgi:hypothetical protein